MNFFKKKIHRQIEIVTGETMGDDGTGQQSENTKTKTKKYDSETYADKRTDNRTELIRKQTQLEVDQ